MDDGFRTGRDIRALEDLLIMLDGWFPAADLHHLPRTDRLATSACCTGYGLPAAGSPSSVAPPDRRVTEMRTDADRSMLGR